MRKGYRIAPLLGALVAGSPAAAADIFGGVYAHNLHFLSLDTQEKGPDVEIGYRFGTILDLGPLGPLQPYVLGSINTRGDTSFGAAGISLKWGKGPVYVRPGVGLAIQSGPSYRVDASGERTDLGSRVLFEPELALGIRVAPRVSLEASWTHISHAQLFSHQNPGIDMLGARINLHL